MVRIAAGIEEPEDRNKKHDAARKGCVASYIHAAGKVGVLLELDCESEFLARSDAFAELMKDVAMHIAAMDPKYISREDVPQEVVLRKEETFRQESEDIGQKMAEFFQEVCLLEQPFVKESGITVGQMIATRSDEWGEAITVRRFVRFRRGELGETVAISKV
jgi:elongation factor Ts